MKKNLGYQDNLVKKRLSRKFVSDLLEAGKRVCVCITTTKYFYFITPLTQADFSMLKDFEYVKEEISNLNGSFTLTNFLLRCKYTYTYTDTYTYTYTYRSKIQY